MSIVFARTAALFYTTLAATSFDCQLPDQKKFLQLAVQVHYLKYNFASWLKLAYWYLPDCLCISALFF